MTADYLLFLFNDPTGWRIAVLGLLLHKAWADRGSREWRARVEGKLDWNSGVTRVAQDAAEQNGGKLDAIDVKVGEAKAAATQVKKALDDKAASESQAAMPAVDAAASDRL